MRFHRFINTHVTEAEEPVEHKPVELLEIEPEKYTGEEEERLRALEALIAEEEGRTAPEEEVELATEEGAATLGVLTQRGEVCGGKGILKMITSSHTANDIVVQSHLRFTQPL